MNLSGLHYDDDDDDDGERSEMNWLRLRP